MNQQAEDTARTKTYRRIEVPLPKEGDDGLFTEGWYGICASEDVLPGQVIGSEFLGGRIAIFREENGTPHIVSAYCPHLGSRLDNGEVVGSNIKCPFHGFEFNGNGGCESTGILAVEPPETACIYRFPTAERFGMLFAYNGDKPLWDLPSFDYPDEELVFIVKSLGEMALDPMVACANTPDYNHYRYVHNLEFDEPDLDKQFVWDHYKFRFKFDGFHWGKKPLSFEAGIDSTTIFFQQGTIDNGWFGLLAPFKLLAPNRTEIFFIVATRKNDNSPEAIEAAKAYAQECLDLETKFFMQDASALEGIQFRHGTLTSRDKALAKWFQLVRKLPRSNPAKDFIR